MIEALIADLVRDEGLRLRPYRDTEGLLTIGVGRCLDTSPLTADELAHIGHDCRSRAITETQAKYLLAQSIDATLADLDRELPWWRDLDEVRQRVLANMAYNLGIRGLMGFRNTLSAVRRGDYAIAATGMIGSKWARQVGARADRLAVMMREGK